VRTSATRPASGFLPTAKAPATGWANIPQVEAEIDAWYEATSLEEEKAIARRLNKAALDQVLYAPLGASIRNWAWRTNVTGIVQGPLPFFWGVSKT
jgi:peptide/nickel transport system substrate-binding protein